MAKSSSASDLIGIMAVGLAGFWALSKMGKNENEKPAPEVTPFPAQGSAAVGGQQRTFTSQLSGWLAPNCDRGPYADLNSLLVSNPNLLSQAREWQLARRDRNENIYDWGAFQAHMRGIGSPDPGSFPLWQFCEFAY